jgi:hypothetical protein
MTQHVIAVATAAADPWEELVAGTEAFLDACTRPDVQRIVLIDGPSVLGWDVWRGMDDNVGLGMLEATLQAAMDAGLMVSQPPRPLAHVLMGAIDEAAMVVARAQDQQAAREEMGQTVRRLLEGLRGPVI